LSPYPKPGNTFSATEYINFAFPEEFERRVTALVTDTIRPLELNLSETANNLAQDCRDTIFGQYKAVMPEFGASIEDFEPQISQQENRLWMRNIGDPTTDFDMNAAFDPWTSPNEGPRGSTGQSLRPSSGSSSSRPCSCVGEHRCTISTDKQTAVPQPPTSITPLGADGAVMDLLQSMTRSILALEKRLEARDNTPSPG
jgi:hypothetical protein